MMTKEDEGTFASGKNCRRALVMVPQAQTLTHEVHRFFIV